jgi:hypothetical protein
MRKRSQSKYGAKSVIHEASYHVQQHSEVCQMRLEQEQVSNRESSIEHAMVESYAF